jgi:TonB family protein
MGARRSRRFCVAAVLAVLAASGSPVSAQELLELAGAFGAGRPGPLEREAYLVSSDNPIPRRMLYVAPIYPAEAAAVGARVVVTLRVTIDDLGEVAELRLADVPLLAAWQRGAATQRESMSVVFKSLVDAASGAVRQWRYEPPTEAPLAFDVAVSYSSDDEPRIVERGFAPMPPAPPIQVAGGGLEPEPPAPWAEGVVRAVDLTVRPTKVRHVAPKYPAEALQTGIQGVVVVEARIEPDGRIFNARVVRSIPVFDQAVLDSVLQWEFTPTLMNGLAVPVLIIATFQFAGQ